ncbi:MAG: phosphate acyltransferase [Legionellales bacterium]|nr:phosphate acyltransferase [Legionellales bacterium]OUX64720.1 MAG: hypothetical protein CBE41_02715 [Gammaproteobacteria bacterium TMED281]
MIKTTKIAIDAMGGDFGPESTVIAACRYVQNNPDVSIILYGDKNVIQRYMSDSIKNITIEHCKKSIKMTDGLLATLKRYMHSSLGKSVEAQIKHSADVTVSAANTGSLMAVSKRILDTIPGIERPAIVSSFPTKTDKNTWLLDLGANIECDMLNMMQFAMMGTYVSIGQGISQPRVAILNIGHEPHKGNKLIKQSDAMFKKLPINYIGYIEPTQIYSDIADVIVCDGFSGNILLKSCEGTSKFLKFVYSETFKSSLMGRITAYLMKTQLKTRLRYIDPKFRNGAVLMGLNGMVVKSHGSACAEAFYNAIQLAHKSVTLPQKMSFKEYYQSNFQELHAVLQD